MACGRRGAGTGACLADIGAAPVRGPRRDTDAARGETLQPESFAAIAVSPRTSPSLARVLDRVREGAPLDESQIVRLFEARGGEARAVCEAADALRSERNGDVVSYVVNRNINYTNVCYFKCRFCAFSKGRLSANLRGRPYDLDLAEIERRTREAWDRARPRSVSRAASTRLHGRDVPVHLPRGEGRGAGDPRPRLLAAGGLAGGADAGRRSPRVPGAAARGGARIAARHRGRDPRRRGAPRDLPGQGHHRRVARGHGVGAPGRSRLHRHHHVRPRRRLPALGAAPAAGARPRRAHRRVHRVRAASLRAHGVADVPAWPGPARADAARGGPDACGGPARPRPVDREHPDLVGEEGPDGMRLALAAGANDVAEHS